MSSIDRLISSLTIYIGLPIFLCGAVGNLLNIRLLWRSRRNPCAFLFLLSSLIDSIVLFCGLLTRILSFGFYLDWSTTNLIWCKVRSALSQASILMSLTVTCLASIERFFVSCRQEKYRRLSRLSTVIWAAILTCIFWMGLTVPLLIHVEITNSSFMNSKTCVFVGDTIFADFQLYFLFPIFYGLVPCTILIVTGILTYRNANQLQMGRHRQLAQKQLTSMMLTQIPIILLSTIPFVAFLEYSMFTITTPKSPSRQSVELVVTNVVSTTCYITFACPFYVFLVSSRSFRQEAKKLFVCRKIFLMPRNRIQADFIGHAPPAVFG